MIIYTYLFLSLREREKMREGEGRGVRQLRSFTSFSVGGGGGTLTACSVSHLKVNKKKKAWISKREWRLVNATPSLRPHVLEKKGGRRDKQNNVLLFQ